MTTKVCSDVEALAERCERAAGPDRELDAEIGRYFSARFLGYVPDEPQHGCAEFTRSIDAAMTLVPEGWYWRAGHGVLWPGWAHLNRKHPDHCEREDEHSAHAETPALALCAAALRARAQSQGKL